MRRGSYHAWEVTDAEFPRGGSTEEQVRFLVRYAVLAPSAHNTQPWTFVVSGNHALLMPEFSRALAVSDPTHRELYLSLGCALANLLIAAEHIGFRTTVEEFPSGEGKPVARVAVASGGRESSETAALFAAMPRRHSNRTAYEPRPVPNTVVQRLRAHVSHPTVHLVLVEQRDKIAFLAELTARATRETMGRPAFRGELSRWVRNNFTRRPDGMPGYSVGVPDVPSLLAPLMVRLPPTVKAEAKKAQALVASSPLVAILSTQDDNPRGWVRVGETLERVWLAAVASGLKAAPYAGPFEAGTMHADVERLLGISDARAVAMLRLGYGPDDPHPSPRLPAEAVTL